MIRSGVDGLLVPGDDVEALAAAIRRLLQDPDEARRLGAAATLRARGFSEASTARRVAADVVPDPLWAGGGARA